MKYQAISAGTDYCNRAVWAIVSEATDSEPAEVVGYGYDKETAERVARNLTGRITNLVKINGAYWEVIGKGAKKDGRTYCHLRNMSHGYVGASGRKYWYQTGDWIADDLLN